jgi:hypothetical protein
MAVRKAATAESISPWVAVGDKANAALKAVWTAAQDPAV